VGVVHSHKSALFSSVQSRLFSSPIGALWYFFCPRTFSVGVGMCASVTHSAGLSAG